MLSIANYTTELFGMQGVILKNLESTEKEQPCPNCGVMTSCVHDYRTQKIREISVFGKQAILMLRKRRYRCKDCGKRFAEQNDMIKRYARQTNRLKKYICDKLKSEFSYSSVAKEVGISVNTVIRVFDHEVTYEAPNIQNVVAIDEFKGNAGGEKYQCIVTNPETKEVLEVLPDRHKKNLMHYFDNVSDCIRSGVKYFISDMWQPYVDIAKEKFKNATCVIDKYHWIRQVIWAFEDIRKKEQKKCSRKERLAFKHSRTLLNKRYVGLSQSDQKKVDAMLNISEPLREAYDLKEMFFLTIDSKNSDEATTKLSCWIARALESEIPAFSQCAYTIYNWKEGILNSFDCKYTNGYTEGCNNKIKVLKRNAYGFRNFSRFRNRILHVFHKPQRT